MSIKALSLAALFATACTALTATAALAEPGYATAYVNVRSEPGGYIVDVLFDGEEVDIVDCQGSWCYIKHPGPDGWVKSTYLEYDDSYDPDPFPEPEPDPEPFPEPEPDPFPEPDVSQVCFFSSSNFNGSSFCTVAGDYDDNMVGQWNDNIGSITVDGGANVFVCVDAYFGPDCATYYSDESSLGYFNNSISSYQTN
jgi:Bacterial SH3 domain